MPEVKRKNGDERPRLSRREQYERVQYPFDEAPEPDYYAYLLTWWIDAGMINNNGMGTAGLSYIDVEAFGRAACCDLTGWERTHIVKMSKRYCWAAQEYKKQSSQAPFQSAKTIEAAQEYLESQRRLDKKLKKMGCKISRR